MENVEEWIATALKMPRNDERGKCLAMTIGKKGGRVLGNGLLWFLTKPHNGWRKVCGKRITMVNLGKGGGMVWEGKLVAMGEIL